MGKIVLHQLPFSSPCRAVQITADVLGIEIENKPCELLKGEHLTPEYLKINPHHTIPCLVDSDGFTLNESRAIMSYLVSKYAPNSSLYPQDVKQRALVDQALYFDASTLYPWMGMTVYPSIKWGGAPDKNVIQMVNEKLTLLNDDLGRSPFIAGKQLTIADLAILCTWSSIESIGLWKVDHLANIHAWVKRIKDSGKVKNWDELVVSTSKFYGDWISSKINKA